MSDRTSSPGGAELPPPVDAPGRRPDLVSILVRSMGRPSLAATLSSIAQQTWRPLELVVVNAAGVPHPPLPADTLHAIEYRLVEPGSPLPRAAAANRALQEARGRWLMFVDDDDTLDPGHVERLRAALDRHAGARVAHAGVRLVDVDGRASGMLDEPVDRVRLWTANRLAIHAVLFSRELVDAGLRFDESFAVYEDWDFWFRISQQERFVHVPGTSATYRLIGSSGTSEAHGADTSRRLREPFYRKWLPMLGVDELEQLAARAEHTRGDLSEALRLLHEAGTAAHAAQERLRAETDEFKVRLDRLEDGLAHEREHGRQLAEALAQSQREREQAESRFADERQQAEAKLTEERLQADARAAALQEQMRHTDAARQQALAAYAELERGYRALTASLSWRVTRPLRALRRLADRDGQVALLRRAWRALPLTPAQRLSVRDWLLGRGWGRSLARRVAPQVVAPAMAPATAPPPTDKERVRAEAEASLGEFLAGEARIDLTCRTATPEVSVVVVLFNQAGLSRLCLQSLAASEGVTVEALIVDNGSTDRVPQLLDRVDGATLLRPGENLGFLRAVNLAAAQARGRQLVLLNNDAMLEPQTLRRAVERLQRDPGAGAVGGPILLWDGRLQEAGSIVWNDGSCQGYGRGDDPMRPEYRFVRDVDYCSGAFLMVRRERFEALGGLDPAFVPAYYEESDFCVRLWEQGHRIVYDPAVRIRHFEFASEVSPGWAIELQQRHRALFVQRHPDFLAAQCAPSTPALLRARSRLAPGCRRVLVIDDRVPLPWLGQGYPRAASWIAAMATAGHAVTHYPLQFPREDWADVQRALPETVEVMLDHGTLALPDFLRARQGLYDAVIVSRPHNMQALRRLLDREPGLLGGARLVYDAEAMFSLRDIARAALDGRPPSPDEQRRRIADELALARGADVIVAVSEAEAAHYRRAGYDQVEVLGHEVEVVAGTPEFAARRDLLFVGALTADDTPNSDSVRWFVAEVWPAVRAALGDKVRLHLVGPCEAPSVRALAAADVLVHGRAEVLAPHLDAARVFVVPTRYAAGIPHKAHEAAARGLPMVVTPLIADQLGWGDFIAVGANAGAFARECIALLRDEAAWRLQREALLAAVERDCSARRFRATAARVLDPTAAAAAPAVAPTPPPTPAPEATTVAPEPSTGTAPDSPRLPAVTAEAPAPAPAPAAAPPDDDDRTAALWGRDASQRDDAARQRRHWSSHPVTAAEINRLVSGDPSVGWVEHLARTRFPQPRARGLSVGCGGGAVVVDALKLGIVQQMDGVDLSPGAIEVATARATAAGVAGRAHFRVANVNQMPIEGPLDLIVFEQSLHHVDALDAVLDRCAAALAPDGWLVINEYVGPDRFQWSDEAERLMNAILQRLPISHRRHPDDGSLKLSMQRIDPQAVIDLDPSEAIHSAAILDALDARFDTVERCRFGGTLLQFLLADIAANFDPDDERDVSLLRLMTLLENELIRCGAIGSDFVYAVLRRRGA